MKSIFNLHLPRVFHNWSFLLLSSFILASVCFFLLSLVIPQHRLLAGLPRMFVYHWQHPYQYIFVMAVAYATIASMVLRKCHGASGIRRFIIIVFILVASVPVASVPSGVLWVIHDMQHGLVPRSPLFWRNLMWEAGAGLEIGWRIVIASVPYNIIAFVMGYILTALAMRRLNGDASCQPTFLEEP